ncbi:TadA family conjugal transfer-associated ATPase [Aeromicrobium sp. 50.2.37]|uniref:TadA family conjugal transfer-associated ATPase n=1 Tax=Aeromicrobium sp. 50.2.37 TaxID=2969305 RepID=UPI0021500D1C|nr:TadA family conjugal transfer-associated ATPase [Aeromicrobium sp. 50.2.37]MCR4515049.1 TadA family conjugal transfer-associated ATPase [Aeromicrobium sp. 50.2.37]
MTTIDAALVGRVRSRLAAEVREPSAQAVAEALGLEAGLHGSASVLAVVDALQRERRGAGVLQPLLDDADVTDVVVNGSGAVHVDRGHGLERTDLRFADDAAVRRLAQRLAAQAGRRLDDASPWVDARLPDGTRLHAVLAPLVRPGTAISLRVPARRSFTLEQLVAAGGIDVEAARLLQRVVETRVAFVVSGGTGSGKTTLLGTLLGLVPPAERLVVVEDAAELAPDHPHVVSLEARPANAEGAGLVTVRDLVRQALRMRPDRLVVGEVRGGEVVDLLAALNTGHEGGCGTIHANSAADVPARFEALGVAGGLARDAVHSQLAAGVDVVVHLRRGRDGLRRVEEVGVLHAAEPDGHGTVRCVRAVGLVDGRWADGPGRDRLEALLDSHA